MNVDSKDIIKRTIKELGTYYEFIERLGKGGFGTVYKVKQKQNENQMSQELRKNISDNVIEDDAQLTKAFKTVSKPKSMYALKIIPESKPFEYNEHGVGITDSAAEVAMMKIINKDNQMNPHIVNMVGVFTQDSLFPLSPNVIIMDLCQNGELWDLIRNTERFELHDAKRLIWQLFDGLNYVHSKKVIHRDIKPQNVFLINATHAKIGDFGLSEYAPTGYVRGASGSRFYFPPELLNHRKNLKKRPMYTNKIDTWAIGHIAFNLIYGEEPFIGGGKKREKFQLKGFDGLEYKRRKAIKEVFDSDAAVFFKGVFHVDSNKRFSCQEALNCTFFKDADTSTETIKVTRTTRNLKRRLQVHATTNKIKHLAQYAMFLAKLKQAMEYTTKYNEAHMAQHQIKTLKTYRRVMSRRSEGDGWEKR